MKHLLIWSLLLLPFMALAGGEKTQFNDGKICVIPEAGFRLSNLSGENANPEAGFVIGAGLRFGKKKHFYTGVYRVGMRVKAQIDPATPNTATYQEIKSDYLFVPAMLGYSLVYSDLFKLRIYGGALVSSFLNGKVKDAIGSFDFTNTLWSARIGAGMNIWKIETNFCYDLGLSRLFQNGSDVRPNGVSFTLRFQF